MLMQLVRVYGHSSEKKNNNGRNEWMKFYISSSTQGGEFVLLPKIKTRTFWRMNGTQKQSNDNFMFWKCCKKNWRKKKSKQLLTKYLCSLKRAWSVRMTASSVSGPCRWIKSSMSLAKILCGLVTVLLGEMILACGFVIISFATISGGTRRSVPPLPATSIHFERKNRKKKHDQNQEEWHQYR